MQSPIPNPQSPILPLVRLACGLLALLGSQLLAATDAASADPGLPYVYTQWDHFTTSDGLPNDHIFAIKADHSRIWIGTENGLACYDKRTGKIRSWNERTVCPGGWSPASMSIPGRARSGWHCLEVGWPASVAVGLTITISSTAAS
jgi:hypothetical protein